MRHKLDLFSYLSAFLSIFLFTATLSTIASAEEDAVYKPLTIDGLIKFDIYKTYFSDEAFQEVFIKSAMSIRTAKVKLVANLDKWSAKISLQKSGEVITAKDMAFTYNGFNNIKLSFGRLYPIFGLENSQCSANSNFMENSVPGQMFATRYRSAVSLSGGIDNYGFGLSGFVTESTITSNNTPWKYGLSTRVFYSSATVDKAWSVSGSWFYENSDITTDKNDAGVHSPIFLLSGAKFGFASSRYWHVGDSSDAELDYSWAQKANHVAAFGGLLVMGNKALQTEWFWNIADTGPIESEVLTKVSVSTQVAWLLTGEARSISSNGTLNKVTSFNNAYGAMELVARYDYLYITPHVEQTNAEYALTFGFNWYITDRVKLQENLVIANLNNNLIDSNGVENPDDNKWVIGAGLRIQIEV